MKRFPFLCVVALLGAAVSAPAQVVVEGKIGRNLRASVAIGSHGAHYCEPVRRVAPPPRGHWETVYEEVLVPGYWREDRIPPTYGWVYDRCGHRRWAMVDKGGCRRVWVPARYETRSRRVWVSC
ncbi:MAG: hypothetical protein JNK78_11145 [Planctomycetes bacterium]|nr:hypothetical protein [Planctomycetota bacterium]